MKPRTGIIVIILLALALSRVGLALAADGQPGKGPPVVCEGDADCDGLPDVREDADGDGEVDAGETDPKNPDTDGDGLLDGEEGDRDGDDILAPDETDPLKADTEGDGVPDKEERRLGTQPNRCDTDADGLSDGVELGRIQPEDVGGCHGLQPAGTNFKRPPVLDPLNPDSDGDGLCDGKPPDQSELSCQGAEDKNGNGWLDPEDSDPTIVDSDGDALQDGIEALGDFDGDGLPDFDFRIVRAGQKCSPPKDVEDIDCDTVPNARDGDSDNDGCSDAMEGGWIDVNGNGIPDIFDHQTKPCPEEVLSSPGGSPAAPGEGDRKGATPVLIPFGDGESGACALSQGVGTFPEWRGKATLFGAAMLVLGLILLLSRCPFEK